ncbi:SipW-cognate class signal peptide [Halogranum gelatinilyticum]|uniref:SipW-cognate class signal peptide n=1 Tax=Halogranum gelatinilyticum TaxID=660521 RepID=A0A1G9VX40_9EURY|nr:TasA family protein [Halogranum gelatinilyticum]SDM76496.1 SipW-cognate class signal peptide [Halogranum gelatinilyticum]
MSDKRVELTRRKVLGGLATIGAAGAATGAGTMAYFSDNETSSGNNISAGTVDLNSPSGFSANIENLKPGGSAESKTVSVTYDGSIDGVSLDIDTALSEPSESEAATNGSDLSADEFADRVEVVSASITHDRGGTKETDDLLADDSPSSPIKGNINATDDADAEEARDGETYVDLSELNDAMETVKGYATLNTDDTITLDLEVKLAADVGNEAQGDGVDFEVAFTVTQSADNTTSPTQA